jgi:hypothetical protein
MRKTIHLIILCLIAFNLQAQRGARVGLLMGVSNTRLLNADDAKANKSLLKTVPSFGYTYGAELGYHWRFVNMAFQFSGSQNNQNYAMNGQHGKTTLNYARPTALIGFNSNMNKKTRFIAQLGAAYGFLTSYKEFESRTNPVTDQIEYTEFTNNTFTIRDTGLTSGTISEGLYYKSDISAILNLGVEVQLQKRWVMAVSLRTDYGLENLENYNKIDLKITSITPEYRNQAYEHWRYTPYKFDTDYFYNGVRTPSHNFAFGGFVSIKYSIPSKRILDIEMDEF